MKLIFYGKVYKKEYYVKDVVGISYKLVSREGDKFKMVDEDLEQHIFKLYSDYKRYREPNYFEGDTFFKFEKFCEKDTDYLNLNAGEFITMDGDEFEIEKVVKSFSNICEYYCDKCIRIEDVPEDERVAKEYYEEQKLLFNEFLKKVEDANKLKWYNKLW
jgi:hypothetical protein